MNLTEALDVALPELPAKRALRSFPKLHPKLVWREHIEDGVPVIMAHISGKLEYFSLHKSAMGRGTVVRRPTLVPGGGRGLPSKSTSPTEKRTSVRLRQSCGTLASGSRLQASSMQTRIDIKHSRRREKSRWGDVSHIDFSAWDPDAFYTRIHPYAKFVYSGWFTLLTLCLFTLMIYIFVDHWGEIGQDTLKFYSFTGKGLSDLAEFWLLFLFLGFFHETAHGLSCKHFGGGVHRMGFMLLYLQPCFFVDVSEALVYATRWQRLAIIIAGIWVELIFCALATIVWWGTAAGSYVHELAYKIILITGVAVVVMNLNPLIKLDGYYVFCELTGVPEIKERSTAFVGDSIRRNIFGLPGTPEYVRPGRARLYVIYALLSGAYSYLLLLAVARFAYNVLRGFSPEWAFIPALYLLYRMFRSRLRNLGNFMKTVYLDKKERVWAWLTFPRFALLFAAAAIVLFVPFGRESVEGHFALEPAQRAVVRAEVPGWVSEVFVGEGSPVNIGTPLVRLRNLSLETRSAGARAEAQVAAANATQAQLEYANFGPAEREKEQLTQQSHALAEEQARLDLVSPIAGIVTTSRVSDLLGSTLKAGATVVEVVDLSQMRARIYVPETALRQVGVGAKALVKLDAYTSSIPGWVASLAPASTDIEPGVVPQEDYKGIRTSAYYVATVLVANGQGKLLDGMSGTAKIIRPVPAWQVSSGGTFMSFSGESFGREPESAKEAA